MKYKNTYLGIAIILAILVLSGFTVQAKSKPKLPLKDYAYVIGCENIITGEFRLPKNAGLQGCWYSNKGWKNLMLPSKKTMADFKKVYGDRRAITTALVLANHESQFNPEAKGCSKFGCDYGLFQIRAVNGGHKMTSVEQMYWFKTRKAWQMSPKGNCYHRVKQGNHEKLLRCVFARHHGDLLGTNPYPTQRYAEWKWYTNFLSSYEF